MGKTTVRTACRVHSNRGDFAHAFAACLVSREKREACIAAPREKEPCAWEQVEWQGNSGIDGLHAAIKLAFAALRK